GVPESAGELAVVAEGGTAKEAVATGARVREAGELDVVLMDLQFGQSMDGITATAQITGAGDPPRVLVLTTYDTDADILAAVEAGAAGYLLKDAPPEELLGAVRTA